MTEAPIGFLMALAQNEQAMETFSGFDEQRKRHVIEKARQVGSPEEMQLLVGSINSVE